MKNVIYKATCHTTGKCYVGQTSREFDVRKGEHIKAGQSDNNNPFHRAIYQYGADDFTWEILEALPDESKLFDREVYWSYHEHAYIPEGYAPIPGQFASTSCKPVMNLETGKIFASAKDGAFWAGLASPSLSRALIQGQSAGIVPELGIPAHWDYVNPLHRERMNQKIAKNGKTKQENSVSSTSEALLRQEIELLKAQITFLKDKLSFYEGK